MGASNDLRTRDPNTLFCRVSPTTTKRGNNCRQHCRDEFFFLNTGWTQLNKHYTFSSGQYYFSLQVQKFSPEIQINFGTRSRLLAYSFCKLWTPTRTQRIRCSFNTTVLSVTLYTHFTEIPQEQYTHTLTRIAHYYYIERVCVGMPRWESLYPPLPPQPLPAVSEAPVPHQIKCLPIE